MTECRPGSHSFTCQCGAVSGTVTPGDTRDTTPGDVGVTKELRDELHETTTTDDVVEGLSNRGNPTATSYPFSGLNPDAISAAMSKLPVGFVPHLAAIGEVVAVARHMNPIDHLVHYRRRCRDLQRQPSPSEWVKWFIKDQQKLETDISNSRKEPDAVDDSGVPLSWSR